MLRHLDRGVGISITLHQKHIQEFGTLSSKLMGAKHASHHSPHAVQVSDARSDGFRAGSLLYDTWYMENFNNTSWLAIREARTFSFASKSFMIVPAYNDIPSMREYHTE